MLQNDRDAMQPYLDAISGQIDFFDDFFGAYPLDRYGIAITDSVPGLAMETMERSLFSRSDFSTGRLLLLVFVKHVLQSTRCYGYVDLLEVYYIDKLNFYVRFFQTFIRSSRDVCLSTSPSASIS